LFPGYFSLKDSPWNGLENGHDLNEKMDGLIDDESAKGMRENRVDGK
jgi:hypothetical protein